MRELLYNIGQTIIFITMIFIVLKQFIFYISSFPELIANYKLRYPVEELGKKFELIWFNGKLMLFDNNRMKYYHVLPWTTAQDLNFVSYGEHVEDKFPNPENPVVKVGNKKIDTRNYENGGEINTTK